jgi:hypothetical protein|tara:strand:+ start:87 stop:467 length:381 start_codon:yes stop_codon:yes gene_type:complete
MKQANNFFDFVTNILFEKSKIDIDITSTQLYSPYIVNRYITFADKSLVHLVNNSVNKYGSVFSINVDHYNFLHALIPKNKRKYINYTKKIKRDKKIYERVCSLYELSHREVDLYSENFKINIKKYE